MRVVLGMCCIALCSPSAVAGQPPPLTLEAKIPLRQVRGRIDHLAIDTKGHRLFVAALGNDTIEVLDLDTQKRVQSIAGLKQPQGIAYDPRTDLLYVANGNDGSVRLFQGPQWVPAGAIDLGEDADNIRIDASARRIYVGYGAGALAVIEQASHQKIADIALKGHPESFQLENGGSRIFVNVPDADQIAVVDRQSGKQVGEWPTKNLHANYPMTIDAPGKRVLVAFRRPAVLATLSSKTGAELQRVEICGDADDVFLDATHQRVYVSCGEGFIDVLTAHGTSMTRVARLETTPGARTALFSAELKRFFVAARAASGEPASVWMYRTE